MFWENYILMFSKAVKQLHIPTNHTVPFSSHPYQHLLCFSFFFFFLYWISCEMIWHCDFSLMISSIEHFFINLLVFIFDISSPWKLFCLKFVCIFLTSYHCQPFSETVLPILFKLIVLLPSVLPVPLSFLFSFEFITIQHILYFTYAFCLQFDLPR
jgi:hypothetical protein